MDVSGGRGAELVLFNPWEGRGGWKLNYYGEGLGGGGGGGGGSFPCTPWINVPDMRMLTKIRVEVVIL